jgi:glycosyltransferase involved in cell wall biosynthesis
MNSSSSEILPVSVVLLTHNSIDTLKECIESLRCIDDIVVVDGFSTDGTREYIQSQPNCRLVDQNREYLDEKGYIIDFSGMSNYGYSFVKHQWILHIDSDEILSEALISEMKRIIAEGVIGVWYVRRTFCYRGQIIRTLGRATSDHIRFYHMGAAKEYVKPVHEKLKIPAGTHTGYIDAEIIVPLVPLDHFRAKSNRYLAIEARYRQSISVLDWFKYLFVRNIYAIFRRIGVIICSYIIFPWNECMPLAYEYEQLRYLVLLSYKTCPLFR